MAEVGRVTVVPEEMKRAIEHATQHAADALDHLHQLLQRVDNRDYNMMHGRVHSAQDDIIEIATDLGMQMNTVSSIMEPTELPPNTSKH